MELPKRKTNRLQNFSYDTPNAYFITICTHNRKHILWDVGGVIDACPCGGTVNIPISVYGKIVDDAINAIPVRYPLVSVDHYVIMPNHVHLLLRIMADDCGRSMIAPTIAAGDGRSMIAPTISTVIQQTKGIASKMAGFSLWQKGFYDHVIRNERDYLEIWNYIDGNPIRWAEDELNPESCVHKQKGTTL